MEIYAKRRQDVMKKIGNESVAIIAAAPLVLRNGDVDYLYRQRSDFYYLSGFSEPNSVILLRPGREGGEFILFCNPKDPLMETWHGYRVGVAGACEQYGADAAYPIETLDTRFVDLVAGARNIYYSFGRETDLDKRILNWVNDIRKCGRSGINPPHALTNLDDIVHPMRSIKSSEEITLMQKAADIAVEGHARAMRQCRVGMYEYQLQAEINYVFLQHGCDNAYPAIVAGGNNACILHYVENDQCLKDGDLVLIDMGAEYQNYASDITRTFPVNGKFNKQQQALYEIVLAANLAGINAIQVGASWTALQARVVEILTQGLIDVGILTGHVQDAIANESYRAYYMHGASHWLGMDVHDVGFYRRQEAVRQLEAGMAMTMEPGLYIPHGTHGVDEKWWGIGIRIEDDVIVTDNGPEVLSAKLAKTVAEIEHIMAE